MNAQQSHNTHNSNNVLVVIKTYKPNINFLHNKTKEIIIFFC